jgi:hypothetical protein
MPTASRKKTKTRSKAAKAARRSSNRSGQQRRPGRPERRRAGKLAPPVAAPKSAKAPATRPAAKPAPPTVASGKTLPAKIAAKPGQAPAAASSSLPAKAPKPQPRKSSRRSGLSQRRGPDGELLAPGELLLPTGPQSGEEVQYLLRGSVAAEHGEAEAGIAEVLAKHAAPGDPLGSRSELTRQAQAIDKRFASGAIEPLLPTRVQASRRTFASVVERARMRRREIGAILRGLHLGHTETSHMDSHGEASLQSLMEWAARLENLMEAEEPSQADYSQFHRGLDHLENTTEALIVDVEATLRRLRDRVGSR